MSRSCCPDCNRWRCICLAMEEGDAGYEPGPVLAVGLATPGVTVLPPTYTYVRLGRPAPCPDTVRERLQALRAEFAARAGRA